MYITVDCNSFFVSCERAFQPDLANRPVIVLSNNDGCAISRSYEAKKLGIAMGAPHFKIKDIIAEHNVAVRSANFHLYGDMSQRVMQVLKTAAPEIEQYSVDEAFLRLSNPPQTNWQDWGEALAAKVHNWTAIPVSVGIAPSKTLSKMGTMLAKRDGTPAFVVDPHNSNYQQLLEGFPIEDIWGVGRRLAPKLQSYGVYNAYQLAGVPTKWMRQFSSIVGEKLVRELRGEDAHGWKTTFNEPSKHTTSASRSFGQPIRLRHELDAAVASMSARAGFRMRRKDLIASNVYVFATTGRHSKHYQKIGHYLPLSAPTADTGELIATALTALDKCFVPGLSYKKAGVILTELVPKTARQVSLLQPKTESQMATSDRRMVALDHINNKFGSRTIRYGSEASSNRWFSQRKLTSSAYTARWKDLPRVS